MNARGFTTSPIYYEDRALEIVFDFNRHLLEILTSEGWESRLALKPRTVADFFEIVMVELGKAAVHVVIDEHPSEIPDAIPFSRDSVHAAYDPDYAHRFWKALLQADRVLEEFRTGFIGKCSPAHFFSGRFGESASNRCLIPASASAMRPASISVASAFESPHALLTATMADWIHLSADRS